MNHVAALAELDSSSKESMTGHEGRTVGQEVIAETAEHDVVALFGLPVTNVNMEQAVARVEALVRSGKVHQIATANLDFAHNSLSDPYLHRIICECSMVLPDGAPMLWAANLFGSPLQERVTGTDLIPELARLSREKGFGIYFLGSSEDSSKRAVQLLTDRFRGIRIVGRSCPPVAALEEMDNEEILRDIHRAKPEILLVGFGNPKQEIWIHQNKHLLPPLVAIGIGGALDMIAGKRHRAPRWLQNLHLEWAYRMVQEPGRLVPRYLRDAKALFSHLPRGVVANRMQPFERRQRGSAVEIRMGVRTFVAPGKLGGRAAALLLLEAKAAAEADETLVIDLSSTLRIEAEGIGGLLEARRVLLNRGLWIWLTGMSNPVRRVLQFSAVLELFRTAPSAIAAVNTTKAALTLLRLSHEGKRATKLFSPPQGASTLEADRGISSPVSALHSTSGRTTT